MAPARRRRRPEATRDAIRRSPHGGGGGGLWGRKGQCTTDSIWSLFCSFLDAFFLEETVYIHNTSIQHSIHITDEYNTEWGISDSSHGTIYHTQGQVLLNND